MSVHNARCHRRVGRAQRLAQPLSLAIDRCTPQVRKFLSFAGSNVLETAASSGMGMAVGAIAPSTDSALVIGPGAHALRRARC